MVLAHMSPSWFFGYDVLLELLFAVVCLVVALFAYKIYKETGQRLVKYFSLSFILIAISYFIQSIINFLIVSRLNDDVCAVIKLHSVNFLDTVGLATHMLFMTVGLSVLLYTTLKVKSPRTLWLLLAVALSAVFLSQNGVYMFFAISTIFLAFISWHYLQNYFRNRQARTLLVALAFVFLLFGSLHFLVSANHQLLYAVGHILELFAYIFILINLYLVRRG